MFITGEALEKLLLKYKFKSVGDFVFEIVDWTGLIRPSGTMKIVNFYLTRNTVIVSKFWNNKHYLGVIKLEICS